MWSAILWRKFFRNKGQTAFKLLKQYVWPLSIFKNYDWCPEVVLARFC